MRLFWSRRTDADFSAEVQAHIDLETDRLIADGMSPEEARDAARRATRIDPSQALRADV